MPRELAVPFLAYCNQTVLSLLTAYCKKSPRSSKWTMYRPASSYLATSVQVVLVSAGSIESLKRAYPNYFLDTHEFLKQLDKIIRSKFAAAK